MKERALGAVGRFFKGESGGRISVEAGAIGLILILGIIATMSTPVFLSLGNLVLIFDSVTLYLLLAMGLTFVLLSGSVNLAVGGKLALNCVIFAMLSHSIGMWAIPVVLVIGFLQGILMGVVFNFFRIPSFIATFGMMGIYTSLAVVLAQGSPVVMNMDVMRELRILTRFLVPGVRVQYVLAAIVFILFIFVQKRTSFGKFVTAIGNSPEAVRYVGVNVDRVKTICYGLSGLTIALGAILLTSRLFAGDPTVGVPYLLLIVAVVIVGGTSLGGGTGGIFNTLLGALTISVLQNVLQIMRVDIYYQPVIIGVVMVVAVVISLDRKRTLVVK